MEQVLNQGEATSEILNLRGIAEDYPMVLFDTSALLHALEESPSGNIEDKILDIENQTNSTIFLSDFIKNCTGFYVTEGILREYLDGTNYSYKKRVKKRGGNISREELNFMRKIKDNIRGRRKLSNSLEESGKIFRIEENEEKEYQKFYRRFSYVMESKGIGFEDYKLLISSLIASIKRSPACIISNDFPLLHSWREVLKRKEMNPNQFGFFTRPGFNVYRKAVPKI
jgi:hypothetical protein